MTEDPTKKLNGEQEPTKDLTEDLPQGLTMEQKIDWLMETLQRFMARDTNPLPPNYDERFAALEANIAEIKKEQRITNQKLGKLALDTLETHAQQQDLMARVDALESRPS